MDTKQTLKPVGYAVYFTLKRTDITGGSEAQVIITSPVITDTYQLAQSTIYTRVVDKVRSRAYWTPRTINALVEIDPSTGKLKAALPIIAADIVVADAFKDFSRLHNYGKAGFRMSTAPIVVEISNADAEDLRSLSTPYKLINRINKAITARSKTAA